MIDYTYEYLFYEDSVDKQLKIEAEDGSVITNDDIFSESMTLDESICSETSLTFGCCESSKFYVKIANRFTSLYGQWLDVSITPDANSNTGDPAILGEMELGEAVLGYDGYQNREIPFVLGRYKVQSDKPTADRVYREITAYDAMYDIIHADGTEVAEWYNTILPENDSTTTMKKFRESFLDHFGIQAISTSLVNDDMVIEKTITTSSLSGQRVIKAICEINGVFGHITRDGKFEYLQLGVIDTNDAYDIPINMYSDYEDFETTVINCLQIREDDSDPGVVYGSGANRYIISGDFLLYGKTTADLITVAENLYPVINKITYRPSTIEAPGNPCLEVGDVIHLSTKYQEIYTYILKRNLAGIQALTDNYTSDGTETYVDNGGSDSVQEQIEQIKSRTKELANEIDNQEEKLNVVVETIEADYAEFLVLVAEVANIQTLFAEYATIEELEAAVATIEDLYVTYEEVNTILAEYALVVDLEAAYGYIQALDSDIADILFLLAGNAGVGSLEAIHLTTANAVIDEAVITEALINTVLADIIKSNIIYTDEITIMSENGGIIIAGTTMQFSDSNGTVRLQLGEDADGNFTFVLYDETGTGIMIDSEGIHESAVPDGLIVDSMVSDDANISGYKLNIDEVTQILNEQGQLQMNATQITIDGETLDYRLTQMTQEIAAIEAMGIESVVNYYALGGKDEPPCDPEDESGSSILGEMVLGEAPLGYTVWTTERLVAYEDQYLWYCQKITYVDGTVVWTTPTLITDDWIRSTVSTAITELEVIQGQIEAKVWETDIETATSSIWEQLITIEDNYADIVIDLSSISETVANVVTTESDHYISLSSDISNITIELGSITSTVQNVQESIENIENYAVTNTTMEYYKSTSMTECVGGEWSTTAPKEEEGYYIWMRVTVTYGLGTESSTVTTDPICLTALGEENISIISVETYYSVSESPTLYQPHDTENPALVGMALVDTALVGITGVWTTEQPIDLSNNEYLWESFLITYSNGETAWTNATCLTEEVIINGEARTLKESYSQIVQTINSITLKVVSSGSDGALGGIASIVMTVGDVETTGMLDLSNVRQAFADDNSQIIISAGTITFNSGTLIINSNNLSLDSNGNATFSGNLDAPTGTIGGWSVSNGQLYADSNSKRTALQAPSSSIDYVIAIGGSPSSDYSSYPFRVDKNGNMYAENGEFSGDLNGATGTFAGYLDAATGTFRGLVENVDAYNSAAILMNGSWIWFYDDYTPGSGFGGSGYCAVISPNAYYVDSSGGEKRYFTIETYYSGIVLSASVNNHGADQIFIYPRSIASGYSVEINYGLYCGDNFYVAGTKSRVIETDHYGELALYSFETATPMFGDSGSGTIGESGEISIFIDPDFYETISSNDYQVFITKTSNGGITWVEKMDGYFKVHGDPGETFDWLIFAHQKDATLTRLETFIEEENMKIRKEEVA